MFLCNSCVIQYALHHPTSAQLTGATYKLRSLVEALHQVSAYVFQAYSPDTLEARTWGWQEAERCVTYCMDSTVGRNWRVVATSGPTLVACRCNQALIHKWWQFDFTHPPQIVCTPAKYYYKWTRAGRQFLRDCSTTSFRQHLNQYWGNESVIEKGYLSWVCRGWCRWRRLKAYAEMNKESE